MFAMPFAAGSLFCSRTFVDSNAVCHDILHFSVRVLGTIGLRRPRQQYPRDENATLAWLPCFSLRLTTLFTRRRMIDRKSAHGYRGSDAWAAVQLPIAVNGSHVGHELFRLTSIRASRAAFLAISS